jgi:hypothetical protein
VCFVKLAFRLDSVERRSVRESLEAERIPRRRQHRLYHFRPFDRPISCFCLKGVNVVFVVTLLILLAHSITFIGFYDQPFI